VLTGPVVELQLVIPFTPVIAHVPAPFGISAFVVPVTRVVKVMGSARFAVLALAVTEMADGLTVATVVVGATSEFEVPAL